MVKVEFKSEPLHGKIEKVLSRNKEDSAVLKSQLLADLIDR
jgi:hypothetical protein